MDFFFQLVCTCTILNALSLTVCSSSSTPFDQQRTDSLSPAHPLVTDQTRHMKKKRKKKHPHTKHIQLLTLFFFFNNSSANLIWSALDLHFPPPHPFFGQTPILSSELNKLFLFERLCQAHSRGKLLLKNHFCGPCGKGSK